MMGNLLRPLERTVTAADGHSYERAALQSLFLSQLQRQQQQTTMQQAMLNHIQAINENIRGGQGASQGSVAAQLAAQSAFFNAASNK